MIVIFISLDVIQIAYTDTVNHNQHVVLAQKSPGVFAVVKQGVRIRNFLQNVVQLQRNLNKVKSNNYMNNPICICLSAKNKKSSQSIFQSLSLDFERNLLYYDIDPIQYKQLPFNRAILNQNQICYGQGFSQLRPKQEMRLALLSLINNATKKQLIFIQANSNQIKQLKKDGFLNIIEGFNIETFNKILTKIQEQENKIVEQTLTEPAKQIIQKHYFAKDYLIKLSAIHKNSSISKINPFDNKMLTLTGLISTLYKPTVYYNISPKSWVPHQKSKQISSYIFHNLSDNQLYIAKTSKIKQFSNQEDYEKKILAYYLSYFIYPQAYILPQDKNISLIKFSKIKNYQSKRAYFNVRPYIQNLRNITQLGINIQELLNIFRKGNINGHQVRGIGGLVLLSWIFNESFGVKGICEQISFLSLNKMDGQINFVNQSTFQAQGTLSICKIDYFDILNTENYKVVNKQFTLLNSPQKIKINLEQLYPQYLKQMSSLLQNINDQKMSFLKSILNYYRWNTKLSYFQEIIKFRLEAIRSIISSFQIAVIPNQSLLAKYSQLACLLTQQNYQHFMLPSKNIYSASEFSFNSFTSNQSDHYEELKQPQNPYLVYTHKTCSFAIYHISFPIHTFLRWIKSTNKYQIIEYISMINHTFQDYLVMDKRLKLTTQNQKKNAILVVDHAELCESLVNKPKSIKTVIIFRLKKINSIQNLALISEDTQTVQNLFESKDELIRTLWSSGLKQFGNNRQFQLYQWVLTSYIKSKCSIYHLNFKTALQFLCVLHKSISTNRHRLKQLQQTHPTYFNYLYAYPIVKQNQKILLNYRLFEFLHAKYLFQNILNDTWSRKLQTHQNSSVIYCQKLINIELTQKLMKKLTKYLYQLDDRNLWQDYEYKKSDVLQLVRSITQISSQQLQQQKPYSYYFQVFLKFIKLSNFNNIQHITSNSEYLVTVDQQSISIFHQNIQIRQIKLSSSQNWTILAVTIIQNYVYLMIHANQKELFITKLCAKQQQQANNNRIYLSNSILGDCIRSLQQINTLQQIKFHFYQHYICCILAYSQRLQVLYLNPNQHKDTFIKQYKFDSMITLFQILSPQQYILCITTKTILKINLIIQNSTQQVQEVAQVKGIIDEFSKLYVQLHNNLAISILIYNKSILHCYHLSRNAVYLQKSMFQLNKNIKTLTLNHNKLLIFFEGSDILQIFYMSMSPSPSLNRCFRYYQVEKNCESIYLFSNTLYLRGGNHYLKCLEILNSQW